MNEYEYCGSNPVNYVDPSGMEFDEPGFVGSMIPFVGSWRSLAHDIYVGDYGWAVVHGAEFALDCTLVGGIAKAGAKVGLKAMLRAPTLIKIFIGKGALRSSPIHVAWEVGGRLLHGNPFSRVIPFADAASWLARARSFSLPVLSEALAGLTRQKSLSCVTAAWSAWSRGNLHIPSFLLSHLSVEALEAALGKHVYTSVCP